ncbi:MAG: amino acid ABC transporter permease [Clostridia bacterium]|nr:amino acid ABC transporter permease [Clostridia bacterium]
MPKSSSDLRREFQKKIAEYINTTDIKEEKCTITYYEVDKTFVLYAEDSIVDCVYGGILKISDEVSKITTYTDVNGETVAIQSPNITKGFNECFEVRYTSAKPDTAPPLIRAWNDLKADFHKNFIEHDRWLTILSGLWTTIRLTIFALLIGIVLGFLVAFVRCTHDKLDKKGPLLKFLNWMCNVYLTITRGTPVVVQIMIIYFVIFMPWGLDKFLSAVICFGLNSGAYVAEIVRGGIMSIDDGQTEAGRSLGFGYMPTMFHIVFPQAFKAVLPALANEFVVLLKETSIAFYIGIGDLMYSGNAIRAATYSAFMPLVTVAIIYLVMVLILSKLVSILERKLRNNER